jgi:hypothetical protein
LGPTNMVEAATTIVKEHQVFKDARGCCSGASDTWLFVAPLVDIVRLTMGGKVVAVPIKVEANVRDVFFQERELWIWIPDICSDAKWVFVAIRQT